MTNQQRGNPRVTIRRGTLDKLKWLAARDDRPLINELTVVLREAIKRRGLRVSDLDAAPAGWTTARRQRLSVAKRNPNLICDECLRRLGLTGSVADLILHPVCMFCSRIVRIGEESGECS